MAFWRVTYLDYKGGDGEILEWVGSGDTEDDALDNFSVSCPGDEILTVDMLVPASGPDARARKEFLERENIAEESIWTHVETDAHYVITYVGDLAMDNPDIRLEEFDREDGRRDTRTINLHLLMCFYTPGT